MAPFRSLRRYNPDQVLRVPPMPPMAAQGGSQLRLRSSPRNRAMVGESVRAVKARKPAVSDGRDMQIFYLNPNP